MISSAGVFLSNWLSDIFTSSNCIPLNSAKWLNCAHFIWFISLIKRFSQEWNAALGKQWLLYFNRGLHADSQCVCQTEIECVLSVLEMIWCQNHDLTPTHVPLFRETLRISTTFPPTDWFIMWIKAPLPNTHPCCTMLSWRIILIIKAIRPQKQSSCQHLVGPGTHTHTQFFG